MHSSLIKLSWDIMFSVGVNLGVDQPVKLAE